MSLDHLPVGLEMDVSYPEFAVRLTLLSATRLRFEIKEGPFARIETFGIQFIPLGNGIFADVTIGPTSLAAAAPQLRRLYQTRRIARVQNPPAGLNRPGLPEASTNSAISR